MMEIDIVALEKSFKGVKILDGINLRLPAGMITVIIGPSGTGKSVLLKQVLGLIKPDAGQILIDRKSVV